MRDLVADADGELEIEPGQMAARAFDWRSRRRISLLVAEDHSVMRRGLVELLSVADDLEVVGTAANGAEAIELAAELRPDVVLMDISMPDVDGIRATGSILEAEPRDTRRDAHRVL